MNKNSMHAFLTAQDATGDRRPHRQWGWLESCTVLAFLSLVGQLAAPWAHRIWREWPAHGQWPTAGLRTAAAAVVDTPGRGEEEVNYWLYLPLDYDTRESWPLVLYLHGSGSRGDHLDQFNDLGPLRWVAEGHHFPFVLVAPQCRTGRQWEPDLLLALLDRLSDSYAIDSDRICITGYSMGGYGTFALVATAPDRFAAAVPVAGGGEVDQAKSLVQVRIWCFHGEHDDPERSSVMVRAIREADGQPQLTVLENQGHDVDALVYSREDLYEWILTHERKKP